MGGFVIRHKGIHNLEPKIRSILKLFRLNRVNTGTFVKLNKATTNMLRIIGPYVVYGYPNIDTIFNLVYLRGFCMFNGALVALTNSLPITHALGKFGIHFIDDIVKNCIRW